MKYIHYEKRMLFRIILGLYWLNEFQIPVDGDYDFSGRLMNGKQTEEPLRLIV